MLPKSHSRLGRKRLGLPRQVPRHWQASLRQDLYLVVTGSVLGFPSASLHAGSQLECPVSIFRAASTSAPPYKADPGHHSHRPFWSPFTTRGSIRGWVFYNPPIPGDTKALIMGLLMCDSGPAAAEYARGGWGGGADSHEQRRVVGAIRQSAQAALQGPPHVATHPAWPQDPPPRLPPPGQWDHSLRGT
jgi:hypothetical protein